QWEEEKAAFDAEWQERSNHIDAKRQSYMARDPEAVVDYCDMVLTNSKYPDYFPQTFELDYNPVNRILIVDYQLPPKESLPTLKEVRYIASKDEFTEKHISASELNKLYDEVLYQICLRTVHELFEADAVDALYSVVFNGYVRSIDPATGGEKNACILSLQAAKDEFMTYNLEAIDPRLCFKNLKRVGSSKLHSITPVAPILMMSREDKRFVDSYTVMQG